MGIERSPLCQQRGPSGLALDGSTGEVGMELTWRGFEFTVVVRRKHAEQAESRVETLSETARAARRDAESKHILASGCRHMTLTR